MDRVRELWDGRTCGFRIQGISSKIMIIGVRIYPRGAQPVLVGSSEGVEGGVINDKSHHVPSPNFSHIPFPSLSFCPNPSPIFSSWFVIPTPGNPNPIFLGKKKGTWSNASYNTKWVPKFVVIITIFFFQAGDIRRSNGTQKFILRPRSSGFLCSQNLTMHFCLADWGLWVFSRAVKKKNDLRFAILIISHCHKWWSKLFELFDTKELLYKLYDKTKEYVKISAFQRL